MALAEANPTDLAMSASVVHRAWIATVHAHRRDVPTTWTPTKPTHTARPLDLEAARRLDATNTADARHHHHATETVNSQEEEIVTEAGLDRRRGGKICQETICLGETLSATRETSVILETIEMIGTGHMLVLALVALRFLATGTVVRCR